MIKLLFLLVVNFKTIIIFDNRFFNANLICIRCKFNTNQCNCNLYLKNNLDTLSEQNIIQPHLYVNRQRFYTHCNFDP